MNEYHFQRFSACGYFLSSRGRRARDRELLNVSSSQTEYLLYVSEVIVFLNSCRAVQFRPLVSISSHWCWTQLHVVFKLWSYILPVLLIDLGSFLIVTQQNWHNKIDFCSLFISKIIENILIYVWSLYILLYLKAMCLRDCSVG